MLLPYPFCPFEAPSTRKEFFKAVMTEAGLCSSLQRI
jgi:hypothetical protein